MKVLTATDFEQSRIDHLNEGKRMKHMNTWTVTLLLLGGSSLPVLAQSTTPISAGGQRITDVASGEVLTDAVNLNQLLMAERLAQLSDLRIAASGRAHADAGDFNTLRTALEHADNGDASTLRSAKTYADSGDSNTLRLAKDHAANGDASTLRSATTYADSGDANTLQKAKDNAADGDASTLGAARTYSDTGDARTLQSANSYTEQRVQQIVALDLGQLRTDIDDRFGQQDRRIDRNGAMSAAMMQMAGNSAYAKPGRGRLAVGAGYQKGETAASIGYGRRLGDNVSLSIGAAFSGSENSGGIGFGVDL